MACNHIQSVILAFALWQKNMNLIIWAFLAGSNIGLCGLHLTQHRNKRIIGGNKSSRYPACFLSSNCCQLIFTCLRLADFKYVYNMVHLLSVKDI